MKSRLRILAPILVLLVLGWAASKIFAPARPQDLFSGYVEGDLVQIGPIEGERLKKLNVEPGEQVASGAALFTMATPVLDQQRVAARSQVDQAEANLKNLQEALQRPEQIAVLEAAVTSAKAALVLSQTDFQRQETLLSKGAATVAARDQARFARDRDQANLARRNGRSKRAAFRRGRRKSRPPRPPSFRPGRNCSRSTSASRARPSMRRRRPSCRTSISGPARSSPPASRSSCCCRRKTAASASSRPSRSWRASPSARQSPSPATIARRGSQARVTYISQQAEFTPPVIFSLQERGKLVFRIDARLDDPSVLLPLGLPVTTRLVAPKTAAPEPAK